jgi:hypothetical protein
MTSHRGKILITTLWGADAVSTTVLTRLSVCCLLHFEPFYTKKTMGKSGTGLDMSVVWRTVKDHDGYIDVKTEEGTGTTFTLYIPVTRSEMQRASTVCIEDYLGNNESILVVDDSPGAKGFGRKDGAAARL